jgi:ASC-1-like (ASCH) protein
MEYNKTGGSTDSSYHKITLQQKYLDLIKSNKKTVEGRLNTGRFKNIKVGDIVEWFSSNNKVITEIIFIHKYDSFENMLKHETIDLVLPGIKSISEGVDIYNEFYEEKIKLIDDHDKVLAFGVRTIDF